MAPEISLMCLPGILEIIISKYKAVLRIHLILMLNFDEPFRNQEIFIISLFSIVQTWALRVKFFFCSFWLIFCPLDPDPGSQSLADPTDPDPDPNTAY